MHMHDKGPSMAYDGHSRLSLRRKKFFFYQNDIIY